MKLNFPVLVFMCVMFFSCTRGISGAGVFKNEKIEPALRASMEKMNLQVYEYLREDNYEMLSQLFSDSLKSRIQPAFEQKFLPQIQKVVRGRAYKKFDDFYIKRQNPKDTIHIASGKGDNAYQLKFIVPDKEIFVSMVTSGDSMNEVMITLIYVKDNGKWKILNLIGEDYSLNRMDAIAAYKYSQKLETCGDLMDAYNIQTLSDHCMNPGGGIFTFDKAAEMRQYSDSLLAKTKARYTFPVSVSQMASKPSIFNIHYEVVDHHFAPMIMYITTVKVSDTVELKKENNEMQKIVGSLFTGIDKYNRALLYRAYNEMPDGKNDPRYYGYIQRLN